MEIKIILLKNDVVINDGTFNGSKFFVINLDINKGKINLDKGGKKNMNKQ